jgi:hypothetical protein
VVSCEVRPAGIKLKTILRNIATTPTVLARDESFEKGRVAPVKLLEDQSHDLASRTAGMELAKEGVADRGKYGWPVARRDRHDWGPWQCGRHRRTAHHCRRCSGTGPDEEGTGFQGGSITAKIFNLFSEQLHEKLVGISKEITPSARERIAHLAFSVHVPVVRSRVVQCRTR